MYFYDEIQVGSRTLEANAWVEDSVGDYIGGGFLVETVLKVQTSEDPSLTNAERITYRGVEYRLTGNPVPHMQRGQLHHWTLKAKRLTG